MSYTLRTDWTSKNYWPRSMYGWTGRPTDLIWHHWGKPQGQKPESILSWLCRKNGNTSAHYVVSGRTVWKLIDPSLAAFHSGNSQGNGKGIGVEVDPNLPDGTLETCAELAADLEKRFGGLNHTGHRDWNSTECPGAIYSKIPWLINRTNEILAGKILAVQNPSTKNGSAMIFPVGNARITQNFGENKTIYNVAGHTGTDYAVPIGTSVKATANGTVLWADWASSFIGAASQWYLVAGAGIVVVIDHGGYLSVSAHLNQTNLNKGDKVSQGQEIGKSGSTGNSTGPHLHFEIIPTPLSNKGDGFYGRVNAVSFINSKNSGASSVGSSASGGSQNIMEYVMSLTDAQARAIIKQEASNAIRQEHGFIRGLVNQVLRVELKNYLHERAFTASRDALNASFKREGTVDGKVVGGTSSVSLEAKYNAQNVGRHEHSIAQLKKDVIFAQNQVVELKTELSEVKELLTKLVEGAK